MNGVELTPTVTRILKECDIFPSEIRSLLKESKAAHGHEDELRESLINLFESRFAFHFSPHAALAMAESVADQVVDGRP